MVIDTHIEIDSPRFGDAEYESDNKLFVFYRNGSSFLLIYDVTEEDFLELKDDPSDDAVMELYKSHGGKLIRNLR